MFLKLPHYHHRQADACLLKSATFAAQLDQFADAIEKFELVASHCVDNKLTKWSMKEYFLKSGICMLCAGDTVRLRQSLERYKGMDMTFESTREHVLLKVGLFIGYRHPW